MGGDPQQVAVGGNGTSPGRGGGAPASKPFVHLHLHTEYSLLDGGNRIDRLVARVKELGMDAVGITDHGNLFGAVTFYTACREAGIKPILGVEAYVTPPGKPRSDRTYAGGGEGGYHLVLLAETNEGWENLLVLCSEAYLSGFYYKPRIDRELLEKHSAGLIAINGHLGSEIGEHLLAYERSGEEKHWQAAVESATWHARVFKDPGRDAPARFFVELQHHVPEQIAINKHLVRLAGELRLPLVCDNDSHFLRAEDHDAHDTLICISTQVAKSAADRMHYPPELYVKSPEEMWALFEPYGEAGLEALRNTARIAERCNVQLPLGQNHAPLVRVGLPARDSLPRHDDPRYAGDLTAWYHDYCSRFEVRPFRLPEGASERDRNAALAEAKGECDAAMRLLSEAGAIWRYGDAFLGRSALRADSSGQTSRPGVPLAALNRLRDAVLKPEGFMGCDPYPDGWHGPVWELVQNRRKLPHLELRGATYFVTWRCVEGESLSDADRDRVLASLLHFDGKRCRVYAASVMPDHVHWIIRPFEDEPLGDLVASVKRFSAGEVNAARGRTGSFWQADKFDHIIRDEGWFAKFVLYVVDNPVEAGLAEAPEKYRWTFVHRESLGELVAPLVEGGEEIGSESRPTQEVDARLQRELTILCDKGIAPYFLIVWDFVNWGRQNGVPALARGSGVGTMVGYVLGLSNACPVRYGLLFERFTDPDRSEYPDIDIDLCQDGRGRVIDYVRQKYGHVAQIITFGTMKARAAIRDVARVLEIPLAEADRIAKMIPEQLGITLEETLAQEPDFRKLYESDEKYRRLIDNARTLEGQARHASVHAAGVIVATRPLHEVVPLYKQSQAADHEIVTQWDGPTCERMGLLKMDFLGLRTISVIERCKRLIRETLPEAAIWRAVGRGAEFEARQRDSETAKQGTMVQGPSPVSLSRCLAVSLPHPLDLDRLSFADQRVFELFRRGETTGVFQFESPGMRRLLVEMKPDRLEDLIAANALFRPGPMDLIPDYNRRKHGQDVVPKVHEVVDRFTAETYGVMVYQEQVMQIVHGLGGIGLRDAYSLIKNISKKKHDKIAKERPKFVAGAQQQGLSERQAEDLFELILKFAGYGFNKSHSTGYAIVAYQTAYLKTYFPNHYMAAFLTYESAAQKVGDWTPYLEDCKKARFIEPLEGGGSREVKVGVEVRPPDVNLSLADFAVVYEDGEPRDALRGHIRFGLGAIKGVGDKAIEAVIVERDGSETAKQRDSETGQARSDPVSLSRCIARPYTSIFDFCERVLSRGPGVINKLALENLVKCGAFDSVHGRARRGAVCATIEQAMSAAQKAARDKASGQSPLFGLGSAESGLPEPEAAPIALAAAAPWTEGETLTNEKDVLGFYISSHPLEEWEGWVRAFLAMPVAEVQQKTARERLLLGGLVQSVRTIVVKNGRSAGQKMAVLSVEDRTGTVECVLFSDQFLKYGHLAQPDAKIWVIGEVDLARGTPQVVVDRILPIEAPPRDPIQGLDLLIDGARYNGDSISRLERAAAALDRHIQTPPGADGAAMKTLPVRVFVRLEHIAGSVPVPVAEGWQVRPTPRLLKELIGCLGETSVRLTGPILPRDREEPREKWGGRAKVGAA